MNNYICMDGKKIKKEIMEELKEQVSRLTIKPTLAVIQVGTNYASDIYIKQKEKMANYIGYNFKYLNLPLTTTSEKLLEIIDELNTDKQVNGILVQMPLPKHIHSDKIVNEILPIKDVDGLTDINNGKLFHKKDTLYSCTPLGIMELFKRYNISLKGKNVVIIGRSNLVGKPMGTMLTNADATVTICHTKTINLIEYTKRADIIISATGHPNLITGDMIKKGVILIDVGITRTKEGLCGDILFSSVIDKASYITPVPGGVGPMTVAMLGYNVLKAYNMQRSNDCAI